MSANQLSGMSRGQAASIRTAIIVLCFVAMIFVFQPFMLPLYSIGMVLVVVGRARTAAPG